MSRAPMTSRGAEKLREELKDLKGVQRPKVIQAIAEAREHGDLKENAEYHAAREQQSFIEGRIQEIEAALSNSEIIDVAAVGANAGDRIVFGATVELFDIENDSEVTYQIVGELEADIKQNLISITSPIARALIGKSVDDVAEVQAPGGVREYEILAVRYE
ncbi:MAG TPA: transcription elongation factor GreA [Gammaproteobacteria bacterium]|nr:transcription elongation factor GreA [Gammaproteobacteria bacterium]